jgi:hypothetical protein
MKVLAARRKLVEKQGAAPVSIELSFLTIIVGVLAAVLLLGVFVRALQRPDQRRSGRRR